MLIKNEKEVIKMINEGDKIRLKSGEVAYVAEILEVGVAYIAEIFRKNGDISVTIDQINHNDIATIFMEIEKPCVTA